jgi:hypothetical protein
MMLSDRFPLIVEAALRLKASLTATVVLGPDGTTAK